MHTNAFFRKRGNIEHCIISYCFVCENMSLHNFLLFHLRSHIKNSCFVFHQGFQTPWNNKSIPPAASSFHYFLGVWNPWWNTRTRFWYGFSNETIGNYAVTCFRKRNNKKLCRVKYFPFSERTCLYAWFISIQPRARKERHSVGAKNGLRRREFSQESRIPRHQGIKQMRVNYFNESWITRVKKNTHSFGRLIQIVADLH